MEGALRGRDACGAGRRLSSAVSPRNEQHLRIDEVGARFIKRRDKFASSNRDRGGEARSANRINTKPLAARSPTPWASYTNTICPYLCNYYFRELALTSHTCKRLWSMVIHVHVRLLHLACTNRYPRHQLSLHRSVVAVLRFLVIQYFVFKF